MLSHPRGVGDDWDFEDVKIDDAIVVVFEPSGKTALSMAYLLLNGRPAAHRPRRVVGMMSRTSRVFVEGTALYDEVMLYEDGWVANLPGKLSVDKDTRVIFIDFGGRDKAAITWSLALRPFCRYLRGIVLGAKVKHISPEEANKMLQERMVNGFYTLANASDMRDKAMELLREKTYFEESLREWNTFKEKGGIKRLKLLWGRGNGERL